MPKPTKAELNKYEKQLTKQLAELTGDVGSLRDEALRSHDDEATLDNPADQGSDTWDQGFMLGLIENEEETIRLIQEALDRIRGDGDFPFGQCPTCVAEAEAEAEAAGKKPKKNPDAWIPKERLEYIPWARYCVRHQEEAEASRESA